MKALRVIGNIIVGIVLFGLIFALTFTRSTKNFLEKDLIVGVVKEKITDTIRNETGKITDKGEELINNMLEDNSSSDIIRIVVDNFDNYQHNKVGFKISDKDIDAIVNYATKYKSTIIEISGNKVKDITDEEFKKIFSEENINALANEIFSSMDNELGDGIDLAIRVYSKATSSKAMFILIGSIIFSIILLLLINWSLYKWLLITGIDLIVSGVIISLVFVAGLVFNDIIASVDFIKETVGEINLNGYIIWGVVEIVIGIIFIIVYNVVKNKVSVEAVGFKKLDEELSKE